MVALLNLLIWVAPTLNAATAGEAIHNKDFLRVAPILDYILGSVVALVKVGDVACHTEHRCEIPT